ncbi:hypothetical protein NI382_09030 [Vibrio parahaemolyticus]|nr:hypothetical protein NI382_09030 [Vibrio parahaemolyticus]
MSVEATLKTDEFISIRRDNIARFAITTVIVLILSIGSLTTISSRQSTLLGAEADLQQLQNRISATIFLQLEGSPTTKGVESKTNNNVESQIIDPKSIERTYGQLTELINTTKAEISDGIPLKFSSNEFFWFTCHLGISRLKLF